MYGGDSFRTSLSEPELSPSRCNKMVFEPFVYGLCCGVRVIAVHGQVEMIAVIDFALIKRIVIQNQQSFDGFL